MRETAVRLLGVFVIAMTAADFIGSQLEIASRVLQESGESLEFSGPGLVDLFESLGGGGLTLSFLHSYYPYTLAAGLLMCFASRPISKLVAPRAATS